jgi:oxygen-independent coproporphyrinogen-3 oxidase
LPGDRRIDAFIETLLIDGEQTLRRRGVRHIPTVYIGGGTPSVLGAAGIRRLLAGLKSILPEGVEEFSIEANPESADGPFLEACREGGLTRISLGVQSFYEPSRRAVHRVGDGALLPERLRLVSELFGENFSADLMTGLPLQDEAVLLEDLEKLLAFGPGHISLYSLTLEPGTPLEQRFRRAPLAAEHPKAGEPALPSPDEADRLWIRGRDLLEQAGYEQYEVSNFARPGKRCRHNIRYWRMENWLGLGPAASGTIFDEAAGTGRRYTVRPGVEAYIRGAAEVRLEELDRPTLMKETLLMGFRWVEGPDPDLFRRRFGLPLEKAVPRTLDKWRRRGMLRQDRTALTREGLLFLNAFLLDAFGELANKE